MAMTPEERYLNDPMFHQLADMIENFLHKAEFTPSELREAVILGCIHYESKKVPRQVIFPADNLRSMIGGKFHRWVIKGAKYYNEETGWVDDRLDATIYTDEGKKSMELPRYSVWVEI